MLSLVTTGLVIALVTSLLSFSLFSGINGTTYTSKGNYAFAQVEPDTSPPEVADTFPSDGQGDVQLVESISIQFNEQIDFSTLTSSSFIVNNGKENIQGDISRDDFGIVFIYFFNPSSNLEGSTTYTVTVSNEVKDLAGNNMKSDYSFSFTTGEEDTTPPEIAETFPDANAFSVSIYETVGAIFSEQIIFSNFVPGPEQASFTLEDENGNEISGSVVFQFSDPMVVTFNPDADLQFSTTYTATIQADGVIDLQGNHMASDYSWSFTTKSKQEAKQKVTTELEGSQARAQWETDNTDGSTSIVYLKVVEGDLLSLDANEVALPVFPSFGQTAPDHGTAISLQRDSYDQDGNFFSFESGLLFTTEDVLDIAGQTLATATLSPVNIEICAFDGFDEQGNCIDVDHIYTVQAQWTGIDDLALTNADLKYSDIDVKLAADAKSAYRDAIATGMLNSTQLGESVEDDKQFTSLQTFENAKIEFADIQLYGGNGLSISNFNAPSIVVGKQTQRGGEKISARASWSTDNKDGTTTETSLTVDDGGGQAGRVVFFEEGTLIHVDRNNFDQEGNFINAQFGEAFISDEDIFTASKNLQSAVLHPVEIAVCNAPSYFDCFIDGEFHGTDSWTVEAQFSAQGEPTKSEDIVYTESTSCQEFDEFGDKCVKASEGDSFKAQLKGSSLEVDALARLVLNEEDLGQGDAGLGKFAMLVTSSTDYPNDIFPIFVDA